MEELLYPVWQKPLRDAQLETDLEKVALNANLAESAMWNRTRELDASTDGSAEREALECGYQELLKIRTEKLGWPGLSS